MLWKCVEEIDAKKFWMNFSIFVFARLHGSTKVKTKLLR